VQAREPLPPDDPLLSAPNLWLSPHSAASTNEAVRRMALQCVQCVCDYFDGTLEETLIVNGVKAPRVRT
jgi:D-3-phosphoglycerate dehydrogenase